jgi:hypothetical protein
MTENGELHVVFGTGPVGMSVMEGLMQTGRRRVRMVNRSGRASMPEGVEVVGATPPTRPSPERPARDHRLSTSPSIRPTTSGPSCSPGCRRGFLGERRALERSS